MNNAPFPACWVTGVGAVTALGADVETLWARLLEGATGIGPLPRAFTGDVDLIGAAVAESASPPGPGVPVSRTERFALRAAGEAVTRAGRLEGVDPRRIAVVTGSTTGGIRETEEYYAAREAGRAAAARHLLLFEKAGVGDQIARRFGFTGPRLTLHTACASGASAIRIGAELIAAGLADAALVGGSESLARLTHGGFRALRLIDPVPCRPFDRNRRGLSLGEGAGMLVIEAPEAARRRGVRPLAALIGAAETSDAHHPTAPRPDGADAARAMLAALAAAGAEPDAIDHINAHGTGTPANDAAEAAAIHAALGAAAERCPVTSIKGSIGHTFAAAGAIEAIVALLALARQVIPPTAGLVEPDPALRLDLVRREPRRGSGRVALSHSFGFGGANAVLCFSRVEA